MTVPKRFGVLRFFGTLMKVIAWIVLVLSVLGAIAAVIAGSSNTVTDLIANALPPSQSAMIGAGGGFVIGLFILLFGFLYFLLFYVAGETLYLSLAVEENTRLTAALLLRMHQESQTEEPPAYGPSGSGFVNETFE